MQSKFQMKEFVISLLKTKLPLNYYYHTYEHTLYVMEIAGEIAKNEHCTKHEMQLIEAAALWHDVGYINIYTGHEEESCILAQQYLPEYGYSSDDINIICGMIMATKIPQSPKNKLEEIIADADLEYFGTSTVDVKAESLFQELQSLNALLSKEKWNQTQISFLQKHHYFTRFAKENREPAKLLYLKKLIDDIR